VPVSASILAAPSFSGDDPETIAFLQLAWWAGTGARRTCRSSGNNAKFHHFQNFMKGA
jgi:hypothetical protein